MKRTSVTAVAAINNVPYAATIWINIVLFFKNPHPRICLLTLEKEGGREREGEREKQKHWWEEGNIDCLPPICTSNRDQNCNLLVCGMTLQPPEAPGQGCPFVLDCMTQKVGSNTETREATIRFTFTGTNRIQQNRAPMRWHVQPTTLSVEGAVSQGEASSRVLGSTSRRVRLPKASHLSCSFAREDMRGQMAENITTLSEGRWKEALEGDWVDNQWYSLRMEHCSPMKGNEPPTHTAVWADWKGLMLMKGACLKKWCTYYVIPLTWHSERTKLWTTDERPPTGEDWGKDVTDWSSSLRGFWRGYNHFASLL